MRTIVCLLVVVALSGAGVQAQSPHWAYPLVVEKSTAPGDDDPGPRQVPGSTRSYMQAEIDNLSNPPDWFPDEHAPMPGVVARGSGTAVPACASCHLGSGLGHPESSHLAGLPVAYLMRQLADFKSGDRKDPARMTTIGKALSEEDARLAAEWFAALKPGRWTTVVETDTVAKSYIGKGRMRFAAPDGGTEPLGNRIIELPQDARRATARDPHSGFVAHVPVGSIARGEDLVKAGSGGKTITCWVCHGADLRGLGEVPRIRNLSPIYLFRQLHGMQTGARAGNWAALMQAVVAQLTEDDMIAIAAYLASLER